MILFLASVIEQLDLALEHIKKGDVHNARFGLMLADNAIELVLHQIAKDKSSELQMYSFMEKTFPHQHALDKALRRSFDAKVKFAKLDKGMSDELAQTITILHEYRNEVYHIGLKHESILHALSLFYFDVTCTFLESYQPRFLGWGSDMQMPERAMKYFGTSKYMSGGFDVFPKACRTMREACKFDPRETVVALADEMDRIIEEHDNNIDIIAGGVYVGQKTTRDKAVVDIQSWRLAFTEKGKSFGREQGFDGNLFEAVEWLKQTYPFQYKKDPIPSWRAVAAKMRSKKNPHVALSNFQSFIAATADIRETFDEAATAVDREIDLAVDRARGK